MVPTTNYSRLTETPAWPFPLLEVLWTWERESRGQKPKTLQKVSKRSPGPGVPQVRKRPNVRNVSKPPLSDFLLETFLGNRPNTVSESTVQTPNSVSFSGLTEFRGANSVSSSRPIICVCKHELTESFAELTEFAAELSEFSPPKQYSRNSIPPVSYFSDLFRDFFGFLGPRAREGDFLETFWLLAPRLPLQVHGISSP